MTLPKQYIDIDGYRLAYVEQGLGRPVVLLHGNPTSSYLWRNVIPHLDGSGRVVVPDLIGHGDSAKLPVEEGPGRYTFERTYDFLDAMLHALDAAEDVVLVGHDWGGALAFHWADRNPGMVDGIAYMETIVAPLGWADWPEGATRIFQGFRSEAGEDLVLNRNLFVERVLPGTIMHELTEAEMDAYRAPFRTPDDRQPTLAWPRQLPIDGEPAHMVDLVQRSADFMATTPVPKLFINAEPGAILGGRQREICRTWPNQQEVTVPGLHYIQEDSPDPIGQALADWIRGL